MTCASNAFQGHTSHVGAHRTVRRVLLANILRRTPLHARLAHMANMHGVPATSQFAWIARWGSIPMNTPGRQHVPHAQKAATLLRFPNPLALLVLLARLALSQTLGMRHLDVLYIALQVPTRMETCPHIVNLVCRTLSADTWPIHVPTVLMARQGPLRTTISRNAYVTWVIQAPTAVLVSNASESLPVSFLDVSFKTSF